MMLGLGIAGLSINFLSGYSAGLFHLMSHAVFKASLFLAAGWVLHVADTRFMDEMGGLSKTLKLTSIAMWLAGLSLMGIPPFSGFWTKDSVLTATFLSNQYLLYAIGLVTVLLTAIYTTRMLGITFAGRHSKHLEEVEESGHHVHEANPIIFIPYFLLAIASLILGLAYPFYVGPLTTYLQSTFTLVPANVPVTSVAPLSYSDITLIGLSGGIAIIGLIIGYLLYFRRPYHLHTDAGGIYSFLWHRWYLDAIYNKIFVNGVLRAASGLYNAIELHIWDRFNVVVARDIVGYSRASEKIDTGVVDRGVNNVAIYGSRISNAFRKIQTGVTEQYVIMFVLGIFLLVLYILFISGAR
jgi:NADH-quinone oxidoreductase subunit L